MYIYYNKPRTAFIIKYLCWDLYIFIDIYSIYIYLYVNALAVILPRIANILVKHVNKLGLQSLAKICRCKLNLQMQIIE